MGSEAGRVVDGHDTIVIGASEGGLEALNTLVRNLPGDLPPTAAQPQRTPRSPVHTSSVSTMDGRGGSRPAELLPGLPP